MAAEEPSMVCGRTGALMTATLVTGGVDGVAYRDPPPKFTFTDTRLNSGLRLIVAAAPHRGRRGGNATVQVGELLVGNVDVKRTDVRGDLDRQ
jgi:hypothetical protein